MTTVSQCCKICVMLQLVILSTLTCGVIFLWGAIQLNGEGWEGSSIHLKFTCIGSGFVFVNVLASGIFYCVVWMRYTQTLEYPIEMDRQPHSLNVVYHTRDVN